MFDDLLRDLKDRLLAPVAQAIGHRVSPLAISLIAFVAGLGAVPLLLHRQYIAALGCWLTNRTLDGLDGTLARVQGRSSDLGAYLDLLLDFTVYAALPIALVMGQPSQSRLVALGFLLGTFYLNAASWMYLAALLERRGRGAATSGERTRVTMPPGLVAGTETMLFYAAFMLWPAQAAALFVIMSGLVLVGVVQRVLWAHHHL